MLLSRFARPLKVTSKLPSQSTSHDAPMTNYNVLQMGKTRRLSLPQLQVMAERERRRRQQAARDAEQAARQHAEQATIAAESGFKFRGAGLRIQSLMAPEFI